MGTRSLTVFKDDDGRKEIVRMYRQYDGYVEAHGKELVAFLSKGNIVNGYGGGDDENFNGMGCLAAQAVAHFKHGIGGFYLYPAGTKDVGEEFTYTVRRGEKFIITTEKGWEKESWKVNLNIQQGKEILFEGPVDTFATQPIAA